MSTDAFYVGCEDADDALIGGIAGVAATAAVAGVSYADSARLPTREREEANDSVPGYMHAHYDRDDGRSHSRLCSTHRYDF